MAVRIAQFRIRIPAAIKTGILRKIPPQDASQSKPIA